MNDRLIFQPICEKYVTPAMAKQRSACKNEENQIQNNENQTSRQHDSRM